MLCEKCKEKKFISVMGKCSTCSNATTSGGLLFCQRCSLVKKVCAACGVSMSEEEDEPYMTD